MCCIDSSDGSVPVLICIVLCIRMVGIGDSRDCMSEMRECEKMF